MTWAALLGKWAEFARSAVALPDEGEGGMLKRAVPDIIGLQSIAHALAEIDALEPGERALGLDRAEIGIREHAAAINGVYAGEPMPATLAELVEDARLALRAASGGGLEWTVASESLLGRYPATLVSILIDAGFRGDLFMPTPGVPLFAEAPACFIRQPDGGPIDEELLEAIEFSLTADGAEIEGPVRRPEPRQVYRQFDFAKGGPVRDLVVSMQGDLPPGQPQLIPAILGGEAQPVTLPVPGADRQKPIPVEFI